MVVDAPGTPERFSLNTAVYMTWCYLKWPRTRWHAE